MIHLKKHQHTKARITSLSNDEIFPPFDFAEPVHHRYYPEQFQVKYDEKVRKKSDQILLSAKVKLFDLYALGFSEITT
jgi:hypothetical protein